MKIALYTICCLLIVCSICFALELSGDRTVKPIVGCGTYNGVPTPFSVDADGKLQIS